MCAEFMDSDSRCFHDVGASPIVPRAPSPVGGSAPPAEPSSSCEGAVCCLPVCPLLAWGGSADICPAHCVPREPGAQLSIRISCLRECEGQALSVWSCLTPRIGSPLPPAPPAYFLSGAGRGVGGGGVRSGLGSRLCGA